MNPYADMGSSILILNRCMNTTFSLTKNSKKRIFKNMKTINRLNLNSIKQEAAQKDRLITISGGMQCGKKKLASQIFPDVPILSMDSPVQRFEYEKMQPEQWIARHPRAIISECQMLPSIFDTIRACFDLSADVQYCLLVSRQFLPFSNLRKALNERVSIFELYPFTLSEMVLAFFGNPVKESILNQLLIAPNPAELMFELFEYQTNAGEIETRSKMVWEHLLQWGGMPELSVWKMSDDNRLAWLNRYHSDLLKSEMAFTRMHSFDGYLKVQRESALQSGQVMNYSDLGRRTGISPSTARHFVKIMEQSYQCFQLPAWFNNPDKRLARQPKYIFWDQGVRRSIIQRTGMVDANEFKSAVIAEIAKQIRLLRIPVMMSHLMTSDGREVDLLIEREDGFIPVICRQASHIHHSDGRQLMGLETILDKPILLNLIISNCEDVCCLRSDPLIWNIAAHCLL